MTSHRPGNAVQAMLAAMLSSGAGEYRDEVVSTGEGSLPSVFAVTDLAVASIGAAGLAVTDLLYPGDQPRPAVVVDRRLASFWFGSSLRPQGWSPPPPWDPITGDYQAADGWIRLHTNAPRHREVALSVLGTAAEPAAVAAAVARWNADELESAIIAAGGCAAKMRSAEEWLAGDPGRSVTSEPLIHWEETGEPARPRLFTNRERPLDGFRVLDLTRVLAGPVATRFLALLGADVLRIDPTGWDEPAVVPETMLGKRTARLDLRDQSDRQIFSSLLSQSDILVHGLRPGALDALGFDEEVRRQHRPNLIEVTLDAYGWSGPWNGRRGFDSIVQMSSGIAEAGMRLQGRDRPTPLPVQALDHATGYLMAYAAVGAIAHRARGGRALRARLSLARTATLLSAFPSAGELALAAESANDLSPAVEQTPWGPARRLMAPLQIEGTAFASPQPATPIDTHKATWLSRTDSE